MHCTPARKEFKENNIERINKTSVTLKIKTAHVKAWESIFTEKYGQPIDNSHINATKQWTVPYRLNENSFGMIKVTIWNLVKKGQSTMLIQGEHLKQYLNISFVEIVVPKLFSEVISRLPNVIIDDRTKKNGAPKQKVKRTCKKCQMVFGTISELNKHVSQYSKPISTYSKPISQYAKPISQYSKSIIQYSEPIS